MDKSKESKIALMAATTTLATTILLIAATITIAPQQAYSLSRYVIGDNDPNPDTDDANGKIYQPLEQELGNSAKWSVGCAMDNIESLQSFLGCLGAK